jgi:hypothetical protein
MKDFALKFPEIRPHAALILQVVALQIVALLLCLASRGSGD